MTNMALGKDWIQSFKGSFKLTHLILRGLVRLPTKSESHFSGLDYSNMEQEVHVIFIRSSSNFQDKQQNER